MMVLNMDGTFKHAITSDNWGSQADYTYYDQNGDVTTPIDAADKTGAAVWMTYEFYYDEDSGEKEGVNFHTSVDNGVAGFTSGSAQRPYLLQEDVDVVDGNLSYYTDGSGVSIFGHGSYGSGQFDGYGYGEHFLGFFIDEVDGRHYGWVNIDQPWSRIETRVKGWAYETDPFTAAPCTYSPSGGPGDFDGDGHVDADDIDDLCDNIGGGDLATYDLDTDGDIDEDDLTYLIENLVEWDDGVDTGFGTKSGDFNLDGVVNATDLAIMKGTFGSSSIGYAGGNANCDTVVNATDLAILKVNFGFDATTGGGVPEPLTMGLLSIGGVALLRRRSR